jgi:hypothetical protein
VVSNAISQEDEHETAILRFIPSGFGKTKSLPVKGDAFIQVTHINVIMGKSKLHGFLLGFES